MSMRTLTILQFLSTFAVYYTLTVLLPALVFHKKMKGERLCVRYLAYLAMGNFYLMNLVFVLQLLHISNRYTLILFTVVPTVWAAIKINRVNVKENAAGIAQTVLNFFQGTLGFKLLISNIVRGTGRALWKGIRRIAHDFRKDFLDWLGIGCVIFLVLWLFGTNMTEVYGYCASDIPVHNYWINYLSKNKIFVAGVYPYGFHCVLYYIHAVFGIKTFVLLRVFCLVQTITVHLVLLSFLKTFCRSRYMPYLAFAVYTLGNFWNKDVFSRFCSSLPQEFGMIFILPSAAFLMLFFADRKKEQGKKGWRVHSTRYLIWFAMCFSMTLAAHFYNTMIAGLFCVGIAAGYLGLLFRRAYFGRIMLAGILSIVIAILPMGIAVATGTPLEGSLRWGMSIIRGPSNEAEESGNTGGGTGTGNADSEAAAGSEITGSSEGPDILPAADSAVGSDINGTEGASQASVTPPKPPAPSFAERVEQLTAKFSRLFTGLRDTVQTYVLNRITPDEIVLCLLSVPIMALLGLIYLFPKSTRFYGSTLISLAVFMFFMFVLLMSSWFGIPSLMDQSRCSIYLAYGLAASIVLCVDAMVNAVLGWIPKKFIINGISAAGTAALAAVIIINGRYKQPFLVTGLETNAAITCLTNIFQEEKPWMFTICSSNDEFRMVEDYAYHYETITFLRSMEGTNMDGYLKIPTPRVYFFIEKIPVDYTEPYEGSGSRVSEEGAAKSLPGGTGLAMYKGERRHIVMSRMYYWAQEFQKLYPAEMRVYYETDDFVCYVVEQNMYRLFDFSIDYGYNRQ